MKRNQVFYPIYSSRSIRNFFLYLFLLFSPSLIGSVQAQSPSSFLQGVTIVQDSINVTREPDILYFSIRVFAPEGLKRIVVRMVSPSGEESKQQEFQVSGQQKKKLILGHIPFKKKSESGAWKFHQILIEDSKGQKESFSDEFLQKSGFKSSVVVKGRHQKQ